MPRSISGSYQFGESGTCDGYITATDLNNCWNSLVGRAEDYSGCRPPSKDLQNVDGDGYVQANDCGHIIQQWIIGNFNNPTGMGVPRAIELLTLGP